MKNKFDLLFFILVFIIAGCTTQKKEKDSLCRTVICGKIQHLEVYPTTKEIFAEIFDFRDRKSVFKDSIQKDGTFKIIFDLYGAEDIKMSPLLDRLILHPGDSLFVLLDFSDISKVQFSGDRAEMNKALRKYFWSTAGTINFYSRDKIVPEAYKLYCDSIRVEILKLQKDFIQKENPSEEIVQWTSDYITINYFESLLSYPLNYFRRNEEEYKEWLTTSTYFDFADSIENVLYNFGNTIINSDIYKLLESYEPYLVKKVMGAEMVGKGFSLNKLTDIIMKNHHNTIFRQMVLGNSYYQLLCSNYLPAFDDSKKLIDSIIQAPFIREPLFYFYNDLKKNMANPEISSNAILNKMGVEGKVLLDSIIEENKGKVLFVDLWATWCGPCLEGMNASKEIMPRYKNKEIDFIFICVNSTEENWKTTLSRFKIGGKHYFCNNDQSRDIRRALGVEGIPHYLMINKQGYIVESKCFDLSQSLDKIDKLLDEEYIKIHLKGSS